MRCSQCGAEVVAKSVFCHKCGERIDPEENGACLSGATEASEDRDASSSTAERDRDDSTAAERMRDALGSARVGKNDEQEIWEGGYCGKAMMGAWVASGLLTLVLLVLAVVFWNNVIVWWILVGVTLALWVYQLIVFARRRLGVHYRLTTQRFFHEKGILVHTTDLIEVIDMDDITYTQTIIDRMFGVGTIRIISSDRSHPDLAVPGIANVKDVAAQMHEARHEERMRRGLHIESI